MLCSRFLHAESEENPPGRFYRVCERGFNWLLGHYDRSLKYVLQHQGPTMVIAVVTLIATLWLYSVIPKGFFPQQDTGVLMGVTEAAQDISFTSMASLQDQVARIVLSDPAVATLGSFIGAASGSSTVNNGRMFITLKPVEERKVSSEVVINRIRRKMSDVAGINLFLQAVQDIRVGGRMGKSQFQYALQSPELDELNYWSGELLAKMRKIPELRDATSDQLTRGLQANVVIDRQAAARLGITVAAIDNTLYDAFGQRQISTIYERYNQHHVILEVDPKYLGDPAALQKIYVKNNAGKMIPLSAVASFRTVNSNLSVSHQGQFPAVTLSFNLAPGVALGEATKAIEEATAQLKMPASVQGSFQGTAQVFKASLSSMPLLLAAALITVYVVLGMLYESLIHPLTILSTLPSAGLGALLALMMCGLDLSLVSFIGIILLMGIVKKNAIMMVDFALDAERNEGLSPDEAIYQACIIRFRPIIMTTLAALFGSLPLALGLGAGSELRRPLGVAVVGGLILSQMLTLYTTPVIYLVIEKSRHRFRAWRLARKGATPLATPVPGVATSL
jgi:multidrug efflux pump subunit AcrB